MEGNCFVCFRAGWPSAENCAGPNLGGETFFVFASGKGLGGGGLFGWPDGAFFLLETLEMLQGNERGMAELRSCLAINILFWEIAGRHAPWGQL